MSLFGGWQLMRSIILEKKCNAENSTENGNEHNTENITELSTKSNAVCLVDCNNFFVSCERAFNPSLSGKPVIVLSNNDGCAIARSNEAKKLGIAMGDPFFKIKNIVRKNNIVVLSSNFSLYGNISARIMEILEQSLANVSIYSIDEAFLDFGDNDENFDIYKYCCELAERIYRYTGIPVSIGIAPTKTLAKIANHVVKKENLRARVFDIRKQDIRDAILPKIMVENIWGIGKSWKKKLNNFGIFSAYDLLALDANIRKTYFNIGIDSTIQELKGNAVIELNNVDAPRKQIIVSRSFSRTVENIEIIKESVATFIAKAARKLREQDSVAKAICVFLTTNLHSEIETKYRNSIFLKLEHCTQDTRLLIKSALNGVDRIFRKGLKYKKVGIMLMELSSVENLQLDLFAKPQYTNIHLIDTIDAINNKLGTTKVKFAAEGVRRKFLLEPQKKSPNYLGSWKEIPIARC